MPSSLELGNGIADTNTVPGHKLRSYYAVLDDGHRVSIDATNCQITIEKSGQPGAFGATVGDNSSVVTLTGAALKTAQLAASATDAALVLTGGATGGVIRGISLDTAAVVATGTDGTKARPVALVEIRDCEPNDPPGQTFYRVVAASGRYRKT